MSVTLYVGCSSCKARARGLVVGMARGFCCWRCLWAHRACLTASYSGSCTAQCTSPSRQAAKPLQQAATHIAGSGGQTDRHMTGMQKPGLTDQ